LIHFYKRMSIDFTTLLSHCLTRIDSNVDGARECTDLSEENLSEGDELSSETISPVRSGIRNIIEDKIKQRDTEINVETVQTKQMYGIRPDVIAKENMGTISNKPKILFSLKDFLDRSDEPDLSTEEESPENDNHSKKNSHESESDEINDWSGEDSDSDSSDLELAVEIDVDESVNGIKSNAKPKSGDRLHFTQDATLESELDLMDELKQSLDDNIVRVPRTEHSINRNCKNKTPVEGSNLDPINIDDDGDVNDDIGNDNGHEGNSMVKAKLDLKGLSISVVGGDGSSKHVDIETLISKRLNPSQGAPPRANFSHRINVQENVSDISNYDAGIEEAKKSSSIFSSADDISGDQIAPIITLDENIHVEDISSDESFEHEIDVYKFDNCVHGDLSDYICASCAYSRWRCERGFLNNLQGQGDDRVKSRGLTIERVNLVATGQPTHSEDNMLKFADFVNIEGES